MLSPDGHHLVQEERRSLDQTSGAEFDRIEFAMRALALLRPPMTVAVYPRARSLEVVKGRDLTGPRGTEWAMLGVPPDASREHIALAVAELGGSGTPSLLLDLLVASGV